MTIIPDNIQTNLDLLNTNLADIKSAMITQNIDFSESDDLSTWGDKIRDISGGITPSGSFPITVNGTYDVSDYAEVDVNVTASTASKVALYAFQITSGGSGYVYFSVKPSNSSLYIYGAQKETISGYSTSYVVPSNFQAYCDCFMEINNQLVKPDYYFISGNPFTAGTWIGSVQHTVGSTTYNYECRQYAAAHNIKY